MSTKYTIEPLMVGRFPAFPLSRFLFGYSSAETVPAPCIAWLGRGTSGEMVLVDTGPACPTEESSRVHVGIEVNQSEHRIDNVLIGHGVDPSDIQTVIFTHLHFDHCAYGEHLPNARFFVQRQEMLWAVAPEPVPSTGYEVGFRNILPSWMKVFDRLEMLDGDVELVPGLSVLSLPGHTPGSCGVVFETVSGRYAAVGDLVNQVENWSGSDALTGREHVAPALHFDIEACYRSFARLEEKADHVLASHDYRMFDAKFLPRR